MSRVEFLRMLKQGKAQSAIEFMMIVGIAFTMLIPAFFVFQQFSSQANEQVISAQLNAFGRDLISTVESMYYYGEYSKTELKFNFPNKVIDMSVNVPEDGELYELVITADVFGAEADFVYFTKVPIAPEVNELNEDIVSDFTGGITPRANAFSSGIKTFKVEAVKDSDTQRLLITIQRVVASVN
jgi:hypothetical protein